MRHFSDDLRTILAFVNDAMFGYPSHSWLALHGSMEDVYWRSRVLNRDTALDKAIESGNAWLARTGYKRIER